MPSRRVSRHSSARHSASINVPYIGSEGSASRKQHQCRAAPCQRLGIQPPKQCLVSILGPSRNHSSRPARGRNRRVNRMVRHACRARRSARSRGRSTCSANVRLSIRAARDVKRSRARRRPSARVAEVRRVGISNLLRCASHPDGMIVLSLLGRWRQPKFTEILIKPYSLSPTVQQLPGVSGLIQVRLEPFGGLPPDSGLQPSVTGVPLGPAVKADRSTLGSGPSTSCKTGRNIPP